MKPIADLMRELGYTFKDESLLHLAMTHRSKGKENNERLEFLGDSILNFVIAQRLYEMFPKAREGQLSRLRASMVKGQTLAELAREHGLGEYLYLGSGEMKSGGHRRDSILADAVEAIIGAMYLDSDMATAKGFVLGWFEPRLQKLDLGQTQKDSKTRLQEHLQGHRQPLPVYELEKVEGKVHEQTFYVSCQVSLLPKPTLGKGSNRRKAEQDAAKEALTQLELLSNS